MKILYLALMILGVLFISACEGIDISQISDEDLARISEQAVVCNEPYIRFGTSCCVDQNDNNICDIDELEDVQSTQVIVVGDDEEEHEEEQEQEEEQKEEQEDEHEEEEETKEINIKQSDIDDDPFLGNSDAPVTLVEFCEFQGPFCKRFHDDTLPLIKENYIDEGKVKYVWVDFPLEFHSNSLPAAEAAECANEQGEFWEYHDELLFNQNTLSSSLYTKVADVIGLHMTNFEECIEEGRSEGKVQADIDYGQSLGVAGTPTFFINNKILVGAQPYQIFETMIENELD